MKTISSLVLLEILLQCTLSQKGKVYNAFLVVLINISVHTHTRTAGMVQPPQAARLRLDVRCWRQLHSSQVFMNPLPFMFTQTLMNLPQEIKQDRYSVPDFRNCARQISCVQNNCTYFKRVLIQTSHLSVCADGLFRFFFSSSRDGL